jgi:hypothetical protein
MLCGCIDPSTRLLSHLCVMTQSCMRDEFEKPLCIPLSVSPILTRVFPPFTNPAIASGFQSTALGNQGTCVYAVWLYRPLDTTSVSSLCHDPIVHARRVREAALHSFVRITHSYRDPLSSANQRKLLTKPALHWVIQVRVPNDALLARLLSLSVAFTKHACTMSSRSHFAFLRHYHSFLPAPPLSSNCQRIIQHCIG